MSEYVKRVSTGEVISLCCDEVRIGDLSFDSWQTQVLIDGGELVYCDASGNPFSSPPPPPPNRNIRTNQP